MERKERFESLQNVFLSSLPAWQAGIWTALPGIIESYDPATMTCVVQTTIKIQYTSPVDGSTEWLTIPPLLDCPVIFPGGGGCTLTFPLSAGDECLVVFSSRCIDAWWQSGKIDIQNILRMHDLSDGFVIPGVRSKPRILSAQSSTSAQLRTDDGHAVIDINPSNHNVTVTTTGNISATAGGTATISSTGAATITAPTITLNGTVQINGALATTGDATINGISMHNHVHGGVTTGGSNTTGPI